MNQRYALTGLITFFRKSQSFTKRETKERIQPFRNTKMEKDFSSSDLNDLFFRLTYGRGMESYFEVRFNPEDNSELLVFHKKIGESQRRNIARAPLEHPTKVGPQMQKLFLGIMGY